MNRIRLGIVFGGMSEEHPVSVKSAQEIAKHLDPAKYEPHWVGITKSGAWKLCDGPGDGWEDRPCPSAMLSPDRGVGGLLLLDQGRYEVVGLDVVLPVLHGRFGEDGATQGLLELSGIPYAGCDVPSSALCMDKSLAYLAVSAAGIATPNFWTVGTGVDPGRFSYPVFVKPARSGSSFGVSKVSRAEDLPDAVAAAAEFDEKVLIEEPVEGSEIGCAVLGNGSELIVGEPDQIRLSHGFFKIHQEDSPESGSENSTVIVPADIPAVLRAHVRQTAREIYRALGCKGLARVDMFLKDDGTVALNEVNTFPGMTSYSRYPRMMAASGLPFPAMLDRIVALALSGEAR
ncbi:D-alanine--(R)-lactate ligase [Amycolatopsis echigonensis]|uniref:D-alanine--D-alanine ligase n=1 Tax=Amycolatopsis echigonensis TaxID=2576905 RepID=A0A8E1VUB0_9PSEU|nr:D-alanine--(R)-lactate ligase [Amycolatopsis echigonensis]MBB2498381.1 D-alanine--(R)-lactate ligase [Amycolatopsis echigonensis]